ncbi:OLC1v1003912C1 [Oldenlandia corymbosa var. corymbosa]|uniref:OLC1v1003912C1 n=1 Tax=Oldenlandia corymbosa var. corymbosa TaxID=529605 RepID=A0AAV1DBV1_OLDCO|nr:OLC1v1003912C1 [Oldenlandia corymbosa var. corymbosa]
MGAIRKQPLVMSLPAKLKPPLREGNDVFCFPDLEPPVLKYRHNAVITGYLTAFGTVFLECQQSYGVDFGNKGIAYVPIDAVHKHLLITPMLRKQDSPFLPGREMTSFRRRNGILQEEEGLAF